MNNYLNDLESINRRIFVLNKVKDILSLDDNCKMSISQVAELFWVSTRDIKKAIEHDGVIISSFTKRDIWDIGMLLDKSDIAEELRNRFLDIITNRYANKR